MSSNLIALTPRVWIRARKFEWLGIGFLANEMNCFQGKEWCQSQAWEETITMKSTSLMPPVPPDSFPPRGLRPKVRVDREVPSIPTVKDSPEKYSWEACLPISMRTKSLPVSGDSGLSWSIGHIKPSQNPTFHPKDTPFYYSRYQSGFSYIGCVILGSFKPLDCIISLFQKWHAILCRYEFL